MRDDVMRTVSRAWRILSTVIAIAVVSSAAAAQEPQPPTQEPAATPTRQATNKYVLRGCLKGSTLTDMEPAPAPLKLPEKLRVAGTRTIRDQLKALSGHHVEVTGALVGVPGVEEGILIGDSGAKVYIGGGDPNLGQDLVVKRNDPPTIRATMIEDVAATCPRR